MTNNVLDYIPASLNLRLPVRFYKQSLDCPNITYSIAEIQKPKYKELDIFILSIERRREYKIKNYNICW